MNLIDWSAFFCTGFKGAESILNGGSLHGTCKLIALNIA
jgi:hypothetical protein